MEDLRKYMNLKFGTNATDFVFDNIDKFCDDYGMLTISDFAKLKAKYFKGSDADLIPSATIINRALDFYCQEHQIYFNKKYMQTRNRVSTRYMAFDRNKGGYPILAR